MRCQKVVLLATGLVLLAAIQALAQRAGDIDWDRARQLRQRSLRGDKLTEEEQSYLQRAIQLFQGKKLPQRPPAEFKPPVGLKPLTDMTDDDRYKEQDGGLYGGGNNAPPQKHLEAALQQAKLVRPLDADGKPDDEGKTVMISVGMSNTTQEFSTFVRLANTDPEKSSQVLLVDGAQGGMEARAWAQPERISRPNARDPWDVLDQRLGQASVTGKQVQVAWIKQARANPAALGEFPRHAEEMKGHMVTILNKLRQRFPNLRIAYVSGRIYAGYAKTPLNPEPYAYESAFVVRWLIQDQINGEPLLNFDAQQGVVKSPLLLWGPYLWADGEKGRKIDDLVWKPEDLAGDGTHPSDRGRRKVAQLLLQFMKTDPTAKTWFLGTKR